MGDEVSNKNEYDQGKLKKKQINQKIHKLRRTERYIQNYFDKALDDVIEENNKIFNNEIERPKEDSKKLNELQHYQKRN